MHNAERFIAVEANQPHSNGHTEHIRLAFGRCIIAAIKIREIH